MKKKVTKTIKKEKQVQENKPTSLKTNRILGVLNILITLPFVYFMLAYMIIPNLMSQPNTPAGYSIFKEPGFYLYAVPITIIIIANLFFAIKLLRTKEDNRKMLYGSVIVLYLGIWPLLFFSTLFLASNLFYYLIPVAIGLAVLRFLWTRSRKLGIILCLITVVGTIFLASKSYEEDYCLKQGYKADPTGMKTVKVSNEEKKQLGNLVGDGNIVGLAFKVHMDCHLHFNAWKALKESL